MTGAQEYCPLHHITDDCPPNTVGNFGPSLARSQFFGQAPDRHRRETRRGLANPEYPPLADIRTWPLHAGAVDYPNPSQTWWPCKMPGNPWTERCLWDWRCEKCVRHAAETLKRSGERDVEWRRALGGPVEEVALSWLVARGQYWNGDE